MENPTSSAMDVLNFRHHVAAKRAEFPYRSTSKHAYNTKQQTGKPSQSDETLFGFLFRTGKTFLPKRVSFIF
jgi:hypothetical protein